MLTGMSVGRSVYPPSWLRSARNGRASVTFDRVREVDVTFARLARASVTFDRLLEFDVTFARLARANVTDDLRREPSVTLARVGSERIWSGVDPAALDRPRFGP